MDLKRIDTSHVYETEKHVHELLRIIEQNDVIKQGFICIKTNEEMSKSINNYLSKRFEKVLDELKNVVVSTCSNRTKEVSKAKDNLDKYDVFASISTFLAFILLMPSYISLFGAFGVFAVIVFCLIVGHILMKKRIDAVAKKFPMTAYELVFNMNKTYVDYYIKEFKREINSSNATVDDPSNAINSLINKVTNNFRSILVMVHTSHIKE